MWQNINVRCSRPIVRSYPQYGGKGIRNLLTPFDLEFLWLRDGAAQMVRPSIDRKESEKSYTIDNCRFIELADNRPKISKKPRTRKLPAKSPVPNAGEHWDFDKRYFDVGDVVNWIGDAWNSPQLSGVISAIKKNRFGRISYQVGNDVIDIGQIKKRNHS